MGKPATCFVSIDSTLLCPLSLRLVNSCCTAGLSRVSSNNVSYCKPRLRFPLPLGAWKSESQHSSQAFNPQQPFF